MRFNQSFMRFVERTIKEKTIAIDPHKGSSIYLRPEDIAKLGRNLSDCTFLDIEKYLKGDEEVVPFELTWELTSRCNLNCAFCYIHNHRDDTDISFEKSKPYIDEMVSMGLLRATLTGGECLLNKDFSIIYRYLKEKGVLVNVYSNGIMINDDVFELFRCFPPNRVEITIYDSYDNESRPFKSIIKLKENNINILAKYTVTTINQKYFGEVEKWCFDNSVPFKFDTDISDAFDGSKTSRYQIDLIDKINLDKKRYQNKRDAGAMYCFSCGAGNVSFHINSAFELGLCCRDASRYSLKGTSFSTAYNRMVSNILMYKYKTYSNCNECFAKSICRMCYLRCKKTNDSNNRIILEAPKQFCKATQDYYRLLNDYMA